MTAVALPSRRAARRRWWTLIAMAAPIAVLLLILLVYPVGQLLVLSVRDETGWSFAPFRQLVASPVYVEVLWITLKISLATTIFSVVLGYPIAYLIAISGKDAKARIVFWVLLSFWTSFLVRAFAWILILGRNGVVNQLLIGSGLIDRPVSLLYNSGSVVLGMVHALLPLAVLTMLSVMDNIDRNLPRAAGTLGARPGSAFWTVYFPLSLPGVASAAVMVFITSIGFFIVPALLGGRRETMITQIIIEQVQQTVNWSFAAAISVLLLLVVLVIFLAYDRLFGLSTMAGSSVASGGAGSRRGGVGRLGDAVLGALGRASDILLMLRPRGRKTAQAASSPWLSGFVWTLLIVLSLPAFLMIPLSFGKGGLNWPPQGFTLQWYQEVFASPLWVQAALRSLIVGIGTGILAMLIGTPAAFLLARGQIRGKAALLAFVLSPIVVPRMIIAVGIFYLYASIGLIGSSIGLILAHTVVSVPYVVLTMTAVLRNYDVRLDLAAQSLGARPWQTLRHVTLPILGAGMLSSFLFALATSFDDLTIALFTSGGLSATLPKQFWDEVTLQVSPAIAAVSTCLFAFMSVLIILAERLRRRANAR